MYEIDITNGPYHLLKKDPANKIKANVLKQLKFMKDHGLIDNKLYYYLEPTDSSLYFMMKQKNHKPVATILSIIPYSSPRLYNLNK